VDACDSRQNLRAGDTDRAASVLNGCGQTGGADLVEAVQECESCPVVNSTEPRADDGLVVVAKKLLERPFPEARRVGYRDSRRPIRLFERIETRALVCPTCQIELNRILRSIAYALPHIGYVPIELSSQADGRSCLETVCFPGRRKERPAHSIGQGEVGFDAPGVLPIKLIPVEAIVSLDGRTLRLH